MKVGDAVVSVNGKTFKSIEQFVALLHEHQDATMQVVRLDDIHVEDDLLAEAQSALLSRISASATVRAQVVYTWQKFERSEEQVGHQLTSGSLSRQSAS